MSQRQLYKINNALRGRCRMNKRWGLDVPSDLVEMDGEYSYAKQITPTHSCVCIQPASSCQVTAKMELYWA